MRKTSFLDNLAINKEWGKMKNHHKKSSKMFKYFTQFLIIYLKINHLDQCSKDIFCNEVEQIIK